MSALTETGIDLDLVLLNPILQAHNLPAKFRPRFVELFLRDLPQQELPFKTRTHAWDQI